jgi:DHA1 family inner membrane transport protein
MNLMTAGESTVEESNGPNSLRLLLAAAAATCIANISGWMQPEMISYLMSAVSQSESRAALVVTAEVAALSLSSFVLAKIGRDATYLFIGSLGTCIALAGAFGTLYSPTYSVLVLARVITGVGEGAMLMVSTAAVAHLPNPDIGYAKLNIVNVTFGTVVTFLLPTLSTAFGPEALVYRVLVALILGLSALFLFIPRNERYEPPMAAAGGGTNSVRIISLATAVFLVVSGGNALWSFYFVLGSRAGLQSDAVNQTIAFSVLSAVPASLLATFMRKRFGRIAPASMALLAMAVAVFALTYSSTHLAYQVGTCVNVGAVYFLYPYFFGFAATEDASGRGAVIVGGAFLLTGAAGPYLGGSLLQSVGVHSIAWFVMAANTIATAVLCWLERSRRLTSRPRTRG